MSSPFKGVRPSSKAALAYNGSGQFSSVTVPGGRSLEFTYTSGLLTKVEDPIARTVEFGYSAAGPMELLTVVTDTLGQAWEYTYDNDRLAKEEDPRGEYTFQNTYDGASRVVSQIDAEGHTSTMAYATPGDGYTTMTRPDGVAVEYEFDPRFHTLAETVDVDGLAVVSST